MICIWNGHRLPEYAIKLIAKKNNIKLAFFENGLLPDSTTVDPNGVNDLNSVPREKEFYENYVPSGKNLDFEIQQRAAIKSKKDTVNLQNFMKIYLKSSSMFLFKLITIVKFC